MTGTRRRAAQHHLRRWGQAGRNVDEHYLPCSCVRQDARIYYVNPQERKPQAQCDWLDLLQGRAHNVHKVDVCALSFLRFYSILSPVVSPIFQLHNPFIM